MSLHGDPTADDCMDAAQQAVTAILAGDRDLAGDIIQTAMNEDHLVAHLLPFVLADLVAHVHRCWSATIGVDAAGGWQELLADVEEWRIRKARGE